MAKKSNTANVAVPKKKKTFVDICKENIGFFFILPWLFGFLVFKLWPMGSSLFYSFTDYNLFKGMNVIGTLQNYVNVFTTKKITTALTVTFKYAFITVPLKLIFALFIAYILNFKIKGVNFFRTAYYVPSILGGSVAIAVLWKAVFRDDGLLNGSSVFWVLQAEPAGPIQVFPVRNLSASCMAVRFCNDYFPCSVKGCSTGSLRGSFDRRSRQVASVLLCDSADHYTGYFLQPGNTALSGIPGVQRTVHHHTGRTEKLYNTDFTFDLQQCVQTV